MTPPTPAEATTKAIEDAPDGPTRGPWMVFVSRPDELGHTVYHVAEHTHTAIALDRTYWAPEDEPTADCHGYYQPDDRADISDNKVANARLISASPDLLAACVALVDRYGPASGYTGKQRAELLAAEAAISKATGGVA